MLSSRVCLAELRLRPATQRRSAPAAPTRAGFLDGLFGGPNKPSDGKKPPAKGGMRLGSCGACANKGAVTCKGCKGSGKNKANGNPFERFKCYDCQVWLGALSKELMLR